MAEQADSGNTAGFSSGADTEDSPPPSWRLAYALAVSLLAELDELLAVVAQLSPPRFATPRMVGSWLNVARQALVSLTNTIKTELDGRTAALAPRNVDGGR